MRNSSTRLVGTVPRARHFVVIGFLVLGVTGCANSSRTVLHQEAAGIRFSQDRPLTIQVDTDRTVDFIGQVDKDKLSGGVGTGVLYPGNTAAIFLASVAVHAMAAGATKSAKEQQLQTEANSVLDDYGAYISGIEEGEIAGQVIEKLAKNEAYSISAYNAGSDQITWVARVQPTYIMTQDQRQIMLQATIRLSKSEDVDQIAYQNVIEVLSPSIQTTDPRQYWLQKDELRNSAESLLYLSLKWFITDIMTGQTDTVTEQETFQYTLGGENIYERGSILAQDCDYTAARNLRGWIKVFPVFSVVECGGVTSDSDSPCEGKCEAP